MGMGRLSGIVTAVLVAACAVRAAPPVETRAAMLTPAAPVARLALPPPPARDAVLEVEVTEVSNPARALVAIGVALGADDAVAALHDVTQLALFPSDQPGRFAARADAAVARVKAATTQPPTRWVAQFTLLPADAAAGAAAAPLRVNLRVRWMGTAAPR